VTPEQIDRLIAAAEKIGDALAAIANRMPSQASGGAGSYRPNAGCGGPAGSIANGVGPSRTEQ
jgi:hypothetical protein